LNLADVKVYGDALSTNTVCVPGEYTCGAGLTCTNFNPDVAGGPSVCIPPEHCMAGRCNELAVAVAVPAAVPAAAATGSGTMEGGMCIP